MIKNYNTAEIKQVDIKSFIDAIHEWGDELDNSFYGNLVYNILDNVLDIFYENCVYEEYN